MQNVISYITAKLRVIECWKLSAELSMREYVLLFQRWHRIIFGCADEKCPSTA